MSIALKMDRNSASEGNGSTPDISRPSWNSRTVILFEPSPSIILQEKTAVSTRSHRRVVSAPEQLPHGDVPVSHAPFERFEA